MRKKVNSFILIILFGLMNAQLEHYQPLIITRGYDVKVDNVKMDEVIIDTYKINYKSMKKVIFHYDYENAMVKYWNKEEKSFCPFIYLNKSEEVIDVNLGLFNHFDLEKTNEHLFQASPTYGGYPSHYNRLNSIEILRRNKLSLVMKFNFTDEFGWKGFGIVVLYNYKSLDPLLKKYKNKS